METFAIAGGGIAGLASAIALQKREHEVTVFEAAAEILPVGAGILLAPNALLALEHLDLGNAIREASLPIEEMRVSNQKGKILTYNRAKDLPAFPATRAIHRGALQEILLGALHPKTVKTGYKALSLTQNGNGNTLHFANGLEHWSTYSLVADGLHSRIRQQLFPHSTLRYMGYTCWRGVCAMPNDYRFGNTVVEAWGKGQRIGLVPLPNKQVYWFAVSNAKAQDPHMHNLRSADLLSHFAAFSPPFLEILASTSQSSIVLHDLYDLKPLEQFHKGNTLLLGDAAHATSPNMGQGGCQAIEDAAYLRHCLQSTSSVPEAFKQFTALRLAKTHFITQRSKQMGAMAQWENPIAVAIRNFLTKMAPETSVTKQLHKVYTLSLPNPTSTTTHNHL